MIFDVICNVIFGKHSKKMDAFEASLRRSDTNSCLHALDEDPTFVYRVERDIRGKQTPLDMAVRYGNPEVCDRLLRFGARMDMVHEYDNEKASPMMTVLTARYQNTVPNAEAVCAILVKHYDERRQLGQPQKLSKEIYGWLSRIFKSFVGWVDALVQERVETVLSREATYQYFEAHAAARRDRFEHERQVPNAVLRPIQVGCESCELTS